MSGNPAVAASTAPVSTMASAMFFGTVVFTAVALYTRSTVVANDSRAWEAAQNPRSSALDVRSLTSIFSLLYHVSIFGLILLYAYLCEYHPPFPHAVKTYDRDEFFFLTVLLLVVASFTLKVLGERSSSHHGSSPVSGGNGGHLTGSSDSKAVTSKGNGTSYSNNNNNHHSAPRWNLWQGIQSLCAGPERPVAPSKDETEVLNRDQTEEWKGWMQFMFLLYHYYHAEEVYNAIRIMITCYVWMTGFGNFSFFYLKADYSAIRVMQMLWRLNFLVLFLCLTQGTTYILYYICLLHTYFFVLVYATMRIAKGVNYSKWGIRIKLAVVALIIYVVWDVDTGLFTLLHRPFLGTTPMLGATSGALWEWYFRSSLDHWSTFLGMVFALNFPITSLFFRKLEAQPPFFQWAAKGAVGAALAAAVVLWVQGPFSHEKTEYNKTNAYYGCIPLIAYIYFRNVTPWLRSHFLDMLHEIGKTTLETYLMQHHIWLTSDAKSLLTLIPGWPKLNFLLVSIIYFVLSRRLYTLTLYLRAMVLPDDRNACYRNLAAMGAILGFYVALAHVLKLLDLLNLVSVAAFSLAGGVFLYNTILQRTWSSYVESSPSPDSSKSAAANHLSSTPGMLSPALGAVAMVLIGIVWHHVATTGAGKIMPLTRSCQVHVQSGQWVPADPCNEDARGASFRDYGVSALGTCGVTSNSNVWGWQSVESSSLCRFDQRDKKSLEKTLNHRRVVFYGDSSIRHLFHAMCRQLGDASAGAYNTSMPKWSDFSKTYNKGQTAIDFKWAPYTSNLTEWARSVTTSENQPDLVIFGGGAWDRLHLYNTDIERQALQDDVHSLSGVLETLHHKVPVVWVVPTTINSWALTSEEKRGNISEDQIDAIRKLYEKHGIHDAASFVLDGQKYTSSRVSESYDGVHYPLSVYDAGAQILANSFDWLLHEKDTSDPFNPPKPGKMANPFLGFMVLGFVAMGLFFFDGFMGVSYLAGIFVPSVMPRRLYEEAFSTLHARKGLPAIEVVAIRVAAADRSVPHDEEALDSISAKSRSSDRGADIDDDEDDEHESFLKKPEA